MWRRRETGALTYFLKKMRQLEPTEELGDKRKGREEGQRDERDLRTSSDISLCVSFFYLYVTPLRMSLSRDTI